MWAGEAIFSSPTRFDALVTDYHTVSAIDDGIFEPNERIHISGLTFINDGGLYLPSGAEALFPSTKTVNFEPTHFTLPEVCLSISLKESCLCVHVSSSFLRVP